MFNVISSFFKRPFKKDISHRIGEIDIILPAEHKLPFYQKSFKLYDRKLGCIAKIISDTYPDSIAVDIGANVGDSAATIREKCNMTVVCIEGELYFYKYLLMNQKAVGNIVPVFAFIGDEEKTIRGEIVPAYGTAGIKSSGNNLIKVRKLESLLIEEKIALDKVKLIKTDTDGFDFTIMLGSKNFIASHKPSVFFEYDLFNGADIKKSIETIQLLEELHYKFIMYDNFGHLLSSVQHDAVERFLEINTYLLSSKKYGGGICYLDVFATVDNRIYELVRLQESAFIK